MQKNRLIDESSPYLLQHAENPVDWYPWGPEALERAKAEDLPILLSVGYSACHWCHVMERESFEDPGIARIMNENFVCIKVDREERPDIDAIYMAAVQALTGSGGWPMTVFLTPDGKPFYGGTYFPPQDRGGMPAFPTVLNTLARVYREDRSKVTESTDRLLQHLRQMTLSLRSLEPLTRDVLSQAFRGIQGQFDDRHGGVGMQPKFPQPMTYEFLLRYHLTSGEPEALRMVELTLDRMALGGIYDQIGGGFHRYSTDAFWLVPHFEKMLYDNALLVRLYLHAFQVTGKPLYRRVVEDTLEYVRREMLDSSGGFYSSQDADSEGVEGKFFVWRPEEIIEVLGRRDGEAVNRYYGATLHGNFEGHTILSVSDNPLDEEALGPTQEERDAMLRRSKAKLLAARSRRVSPARDDKILTAWNGMMLRAFAEAGAVLARPDYAGIAERNAVFLLRELRAGGRLLRTYRDGNAKLNAYLEDYAFLIDGLIALHEVTLDVRWLREAAVLGEEMVELFWDEASGRFYDTGRDHEELIVRPHDVTDNAIPSGSSMACDALLRLAVITGDAEHRRRAATSMRSARDLMARFPGGAGHWLCALDFYLSEAREIAIVGDAADDGTRMLVREVYRSYVPNRVVVGASGGDGAVDGLPLLEGRDQVGGLPTAYVCRNYVCNLPTNDTAVLAAQLAE